MISEFMEVIEIRLHSCGYDNDHQSSKGTRKSKKENGEKESTKGKDESEI